MPRWSWAADEQKTKSEHWEISSHETKTWNIFKFKFILINFLQINNLNTQTWQTLLLWRRKKPMQLSSYILFKGSYLIILWRSKILIKKI